MIQRVLLAIILTITLIASNFTESTASEQETVSSDSWFTEEVAPTGPSGDQLPNVSRSRYSTLDVNTALSHIVDPNSLASAKFGDRTTIPAANDFSIQLFDGKHLHIDVSEVAISLPFEPAHPTPNVEILGTVTSGENTIATASFVFSADDSGAYELSGGIQEPTVAEVNITHAAGNTYRLDQLDDASIPTTENTDALVAPLEDSPNTPSIPEGDVPENEQVVDLLVGYANGIGNSQSFENELRLRIAQMNQALSYSQVKIRINLLETLYVDYSQDTSNMSDDLTKLQQGAETLKPLKDEREVVGADLVALVVPSVSNYCGLAWKPGSANGAVNYAFSVTAKECFSSYTLAHELGHNLGAGHNPEVETGLGLPFLYSHGKSEPGVARDIMGYPCSGTACARVLQYSNPNVRFIGHPTVPSGDTELRDNARSMNNMAQTIANYRERAIARDVPSNHPFYREIHWLVERGITTGYDDGTFRPEAGTKRSAMAAFLYRYAGSPTYTPPATSPYADVTKDYPFYKEIAWLRSTGITTGYPGGIFRPENMTERGAMAAFLYRYAGSPTYTPPATSPFPDIPKNHQFYKEITWLRSTGITTGWNDGTFRAEDTVTREAMAAFLYRFNQKFG